MKSLAVRTDLMVMGDRARLVDHGAYWSQTTQSEPDFWFGNQIIVKDKATPRPVSEAWFNAHFPAAKHCVISFETVDLSLSDIDVAYAQDGFEPEVCDVLQRIGAPDVSMPADHHISSAAAGDDWTEMLDLSIAIGAEQGFDPASHAGFLGRRQATYRHRIAQGAGMWLIARDDAGVAGQLGIFVGDRLARFQAVETRLDARGRGVASALIAAGCQYAQAQLPGCPVTIVAEQGSKAARLYRKLGFELVETCLSVSRAGY